MALVVHGYLRKSSPNGDIKSCKKRYFTLLRSTNEIPSRKGNFGMYDQNGYVLCYWGSRNKEEKNELPLRALYVNELSKFSHEHDGRHMRIMCLDLAAPNGKNRKFRLYTSSENDFRMWSKALSDVVSTNKVQNIYDDVSATTSETAFPVTDYFPLQSRQSRADDIPLCDSGFSSETCLPSADFNVTKEVISRTESSPNRSISKVELPPRSNTAAERKFSVSFAKKGEVALNASNGVEGAQVTRSQDGATAIKVYMG